MYSRADDRQISDKCLMSNVCMLHIHGRKHRGGDCALDVFGYINSQCVMICVCVHLSL